MSACEHTPLPWSPAALISTRSSPAGELRALASSEAAHGSQVIPVVTPNDIAAHAISLAPTPELSIAPCYELRLLQTEAELYESYRLRYEVYGALGYLQRSNHTRLDVDEYDSSSIPLGAFDATGAMIGTLRIVMTQPQLEYDCLLRGIVASCHDDELARQAWGPQPHPLPSIINEDIDRQIDAFNTAHLEVRELSRCIVRPDRRGEGVSRALMEFGLACIALSGHAVVVGSCLPMHVPMYAKYGYTALNSRLDRFDSVGQIAKAVICRTDRVPEPARNHIDEIVSTARSGRTEYVRELGNGSRFVHRLAAPRRARRRTIEW